MKMPKVVQNKLGSDDSGTRLVVIVSVAAVISVFCLLSAKALLSQASYHRRVLSARRQAIDQLKSDIEAANTLSQQYKVFQTGNPDNIIGGKNSTDTNLQPPDGDNARIVLDALPATYDFPALISSVAKILNTNHLSGQSISGSDQSKSLSNNPTNHPEPLPLQLTLSGSSSYKGIRAFIKDLERSIRPFDVTSLQLAGTDKSMNATIVANTYYQQALSLELEEKEVK